MKKKILALTLAAFTLGIVSANAQTQENGQTTAQEQVCKEKKECCKKIKGEKGAKHAKKDFKRGDRPKMNPFFGIELTEQQEAQVKQLREQQKAQREQNKNLAKEEKAKQREAFDAEMAKILTPQQFEVYQSNRQKLKEAKAKVGKKHVKEGKRSKKNA